MSIPLVGTVHSEGKEKGWPTLAGQPASYDAVIDKRNFTTSEEQLRGAAFIMTESNLVFTLSIVPLVRVNAGTIAPNAKRVNLKSKNIFAV